jgi:hypothetical protein
MATCAWAQDQEVATQGRNPLQKPLIEANVKASTSSYTYREPGLMKMSGTMSGFELDARHTVQDDFFQDLYFFGANFEYNSGKLNYTGAFQDGTPLKTDANDYFYTVSLLGGVRVPLEHSSAYLEFQGGLANRYLHDKGKGKGTYGREETYVYFPFSIAYDTPFAGGWHFRPSFELDIFSSGKNKTHLEDVNPNLPTLTFDQSDGRGTKTAVAFTRAFQNYTLLAEAFYQTWSIGNSDKFNYTTTNKDTGAEEQGYLMEPKNTTDIIGLNLGVGF